MGLHEWSLGGVLLFFGVLGMVRSMMVVILILFCLYFIVLCLLVLGVGYDVVYFLNEVLGMLMGVGCVVMVFKLVVLRNSVWYGRCLM